MSTTTDPEILKYCQEALDLLPALKVRADQSFYKRGLRAIAIELRRTGRPIQLDELEDHTGKAWDDRRFKAFVVWLHKAAKRAGHEHLEWEPVRRYDVHSKTVIHTIVGAATAKVDAKTTEGISPTATAPNVGAEPAVAQSEDLMQRPLDAPASPRGTKELDRRLAKVLKKTLKRQSPRFDWGTAVVLTVMVLTGSALVAGIGLDRVPQAAGYQVGILDIIRQALTVPHVPSVWFET